MPPSPAEDGPMTQPPLRCHLRIGPPGSSKTTLARGNTNAFRCLQLSP